MPRTPLAPWRVGPPDGAAPDASGDLWLWCAVAAVSLAAFAAYLVSEPIDHGYVRYLGIADQMVRSGDWVVPRIGDRVYLEKPPLFVWLVAAPIAVLGEVPSWAQHLPNLLAGALLAIWSFALGRAALGGREGGLAAAVGVLTVLRTTTALRDERLDALFAALLTGAFFHTYAVLAALGPGEARRRALHGAAAGALLGLALMTKGPVALALFAPAVAAYVLWSGRGRALRGAPAALGLLALVLVALPWPLLLVETLGVDAVAATLRETRMVTRFSGAFHYVAQFPVELAPWSLFALALVVDRFERRAGRPPLTDPMRFALAWAALVFVVLQISPARHSRYLIPVFPPLLVWLLTLWFEPGSGAAPSLGRLTLRLRNGTLALLLAVLGVAGVGALLSPMFVAPRSVVVSVLGGCAAVLAGCSLWRLRYRGRAGLWDLGAVLLLALAAMDAGRVASYRGAPCWPEARRVLAGVPADASLVTLRLDETRTFEVGFAAGRSAVAVRSPDRLARALRSGGLPDEVFLVAERGMGPVFEEKPLEAHRLAELCLRESPLALWRVGLPGSARAPGAEEGAAPAHGAGGPGLPADARSAGPLKSP